MSVDVGTFKRAVSRFATGVTVVATSHNGRMAGMTANAIFSLSLEPPSMVISMQRDAESTRLLHESRRAGISVLAAGQKEISELFARHGGSEEKFAGGRCRAGRSGQPIVDGCISAFEVEVEEVVSVHDHDLFICRVLSIEHMDDRNPLIYWGGRYASSADQGAVSMPEPR